MFTDEKEDIEDPKFFQDNLKKQTGTDRDTDSMGTGVVSPNIYNTLGKKNDQTMPTT